MRSKEQSIGNVRNVPPPCFRIRIRNLELTGEFLILGLQLAELHSTAVDYVKTGIPAEWNKRLDPRRYPHFMEKAKSKSYHSNSVLGKLYDMVDKEVFDNRENYKLPFDERILKRYRLDDSLLKEARKIKSQYDIAMRRVMGQLEIRTEFEVWTTFVLSKPRVGTDYKVQEKVGREAAALKKQFRDLCIKAAGDRDFEKLGPFVAAMYTVTWEETRIALFEARQPHVLPDGTVSYRRVTPRSMPLISFPWLFPTELGRIATGFEKHASLIDLGIDTAPERPKPREIHRQAVLETEGDLAAMDYTRTSDGQIIHRGEILQLFRHDDEGENGGFYSDDGPVVSDALADPESEKSPEKGPETPKPVENVSGGDNGAGEVPILLDLDPDSTENKGKTGMSPSSETAGSIQGGSALQLVESGSNTRATLDFLSSDADEDLRLSSCLAPIQPCSMQQHQGRRILEPKCEVVGESAPSPQVADQFPTPDAESTVSDSMKSWDQVTVSMSESSLAERSAPSETRNLSLGIAGNSPDPSSGPGFADLREGIGSGLEGGSDWNGAAASDLAGGEEEAEMTESDGEVEYEEVTVEVEAETALERAARLASSWD